MFFCLYFVFSLIKCVMCCIESFFFIFELYSNHQHRTVHNLKSKYVIYVWLKDFKTPKSTRTHTHSQAFSFLFLNLSRSTGLDTGAAVVAIMISLVRLKDMHCLGGSSGDGSKQMFSVLLSLCFLLLSLVFG